MADNVVANAGSGGATFATDDDGIAHHPYVKIEFGADNTQTKVSSANPLPVVQTGTPDLPTGAATAAKQDTGNTSLASIDGKITAVNTGAVVVSSSALPSGAATAAKQPALGTAGTASADVISVQGIASMTPLQVADNGGSITVDGTVSITANSAVNVAQVGGNALSAGNGASGTGVQRVTIANDSTGVLATVSTVTTVSTLTGGGIAHDSADSGNPHKIGAKAKSSTAGITLVADGDRTDLYADIDGVQIVKNGTSWGDLISERVSNTDGASTAFSTFGATLSARNMITSITVHNAHATTNGFVDIRDGTAGSVIWTIPAPATGGAHITFDPPLRQPTANTALAFDVSAAITTVYISVNGFKSKV